MGRGELPDILESSRSPFGLLDINLGTMRDLKMDRRSFTSIFAFYILRCLSVGCNLQCVWIVQRAQRGALRWRMFRLQLQSLFLVLFRHFET